MGPVYINRPDSLRVGRGFSSEFYIWVHFYLLAESQVVGDILSDSDFC